MPSVNVSPKLLIPGALATFSEATLAALTAGAFYAITNQGTLVNLGGSPAVITPSAAGQAFANANVSSWPQGGGVVTTVPAGMFAAPVETRSLFVAITSGALTTFAGNVFVVSAYAEPNVGATFAISNGVGIPLVAASNNVLEVIPYFLGAATAASAVAGVVCPGLPFAVILNPTALPTGGAGPLVIEVGAF